MSATPSTRECVDGTITKSESLCRHLRVNAIADYYDIQPLCRFTRSKLRDELQCGWSMKVFQYLLAQSRTDRGAGDIEFYRMLGRVVADHPKDLLKLQDLRDLELPDLVAKSGLASLAKQVVSLKENRNRGPPPLGNY